MKTTTLALRKTEKLELRLSELIEEVAGLMQKPASQRDRCGLENAWQNASHLKTVLNTQTRILKEIKKPLRQNMSYTEYRAQCDIFERASAHQMRMLEWNRIDRVVRQHLDPVRTPLLPALRPGGGDALLTHLYDGLHQLANPTSQNPDAWNHGCFPDIAFPARLFDLLMSAAYRIGLAQNPCRSLRFLDVGCGGGTKVYAATRYFKHAHGLDYDPGYAAAAQQTLQTLGASSSTVIQADALAFDAYSEYDVIYYYRPMRDDELLEKMEHHIISHAHVGTILVAPYNILLRDRPEMPCAKVEGPVFVTGIEQAEADQLRSDAEATGTEILEKKADQAFNPDYWAPILNAASFGGKEF